MSANERTDRPLTINIPAGGPLNTLLPDYALYASKEPLVTCPYDPNHHVKPSRLRRHLIKCARAAKTPLAWCHYNATHRVPPAELDEHLKKCPSRNDMYPPNTEVSACGSSKPIPSTMTVSQGIDEDESWD